MRLFATVRKKAKGTSINSSFSHRVILRNDLLSVQIELMGKKGRAGPGRAGRMLFLSHGPFPCSTAPEPAARASSQDRACSKLTPQLKVLLLLFLSHRGDAGFSGCLQEAREPGAFPALIRRGPSISPISLLIHYKRGVMRDKALPNDHQ